MASYKDDDLNEKIYKLFDGKVLDWRYNNAKKDSIVLTFDDGSTAVYDVKDIMDESVGFDTAKKVNVFESLTESDIELLSNFSLTEKEVSDILSLFELIPEENKDKAFSIIKNLFEGKKIVTDDAVAEGTFPPHRKKLSVSERYTKTLLGDN